MAIRDRLKIALEEAALVSQVSQLDKYDGLPLGESENGVNQDLDELSLIADKSESLEDLAEMLEAVGELSAEDLAVTNIAYGQIMADTDHENISLEAATSLSSIKESLKLLYEKGMELLKDLWRKIQDFIYRTFSFLGMRLNALEKLKVKIQDMDESVFSGEVSISSKIFDGLNPGEGKFELSNIKKAIDVLHRESAYYLKDYMAGLVKVRTLIMSAKGIEDLSKAPLEHYAAMRKKYPQIVDSIDGTAVSSSEYLPGGYVVRVTMRDVSFPEKNTVSNRDEAVALAGFVSYKTRVKVVRDETSVTQPQTMAVPSKRELLALLDDAIGQLKFVASHKQQYKRFCDNTQSAWDTWLHREVGKSANDESNAYNTKNGFQRLMAASNSFAEWTKEPMSGLTLVSIRFSAAVGALVSKCAKLETSTASDTGQLLLN